MRLTPSTSAREIRISPHNAVRQQYDQMVKYATALRFRTAETEAILRRFTKKNVQHSTYKAFAELGKAIKAIFLCRYLHDQGLRREITEGLNVTLPLKSVPHN